MVAETLSSLVSQVIYSHIKYMLNLVIYFKEIEMKKNEIDFKKVMLWSLWLPLTNFASLHEKIKKETSNKIYKNRNSTWSWLIFKHPSSVKVTIDSVGFIYLEEVHSAKALDEILTFLVNVLNEDTKVYITDTFLNQDIGYRKNIFSNSQKEKDQNFKKFLKHIVVPFESISEKIKLEYIYSKLYIDLQKQNNNHENEDQYYKISSLKDIKFSLDIENFKLDRKFQTILNRNFENLLQKSIYFTHSLQFEEGEVYKLKILEAQHNLSHWIQFQLFINKESKSFEEKDVILTQILKKAIQDTLEEYTIFNFLKVTRREYLHYITNEISEKNKLVKKLNAYLLDDTGKSLIEFEQTEESIDDEATVEIFIQNLLQSVPKFYTIDSKIKEAYYIKIGNTSTNLRVNNHETIVHTLYYAKWKSSIQFFVDTASRVNDSLTMYHQNKTRKELEDISYNANYQADIEDIRELQKNKLLSLDETTKKILFFIAIAALAGEASLVESKLLFFDANEVIDFLKTFGFNLFDIISNSIIYAFIIYYFGRPFLLENDELSNRQNKKNLGVKKLINFFKQCIEKPSNFEVYTFDESDYDKHEHRSNKLLLNYNQSKKEFEKIYIEYNNAISSYHLVEQLKEKTLTQHIKEEEKTFTYKLFPTILSHAPLKVNDTYVHRENYRVSGNNRIATKIMYRYKISNLKLEELLMFMKKDDFLQEYGSFLTKQGYSLEDAFEILEPTKKSAYFLTLYVVYSFVLKFTNVTSHQNRKYSYTISKDQFRVHYHIDKLEYSNRADFKKKQEALAILIDLYFISRLKRLEQTNL